jgi:hypothetical protein
MMRLVIEAISLSSIEVPRRATLVKVAWQSGTVTEIEIPRPHRRQLFRTPPPHGWSGWPAWAGRARIV